MTVEEYLDSEETAEFKSEFVDGVVVSMVGESLRHNILTTNLHSILQSSIRGSNCLAFALDVKVRVEATNSFYYPDVFVSCLPKDTSSVFSATPVLIIEVLSPSTAGLDRREKLIAYRKIPSLREYVIVFQTERRIEIHRRSSIGDWQYDEIVDGAVSFESLPIGHPLIVPLEKIYEDNDWGETSTSPSSARESVEDICW